MKELISNITFLKWSEVVYPCILVYQCISRYNHYKISDLSIGYKYLITEQGQQIMSCIVLY